MIRFSILINNFNYGRYLGDSIGSALEQELPSHEFEVIVVDDGSTDDSARRAAAFGDRIQYHRRENGGQAAALNTGFALAKGAFVALLDADDIWLPQKLRRVASVFEKDPALGLVQHQMQAVDSERRPLATHQEPWPERYSRADLFSGSARFVGTSGLTFRRDALQRIIPIPEDLFFCADEYLYNHLLFYCAAGNLPEALGLRRLHGTNHYAASVLDARSLERRIEIRKRLDRHLAGRCTAEALEFPPALKLASDRERLLCEILDHSLRGRRRRAWGARQEFLATYPAGRYPLFKGLTLALAVASPMLYALLATFYQGRPWLTRIRTRVLPD